MLIGIAIRTGNPLSLNLAEPMWKLLVGIGLDLKDISEVDKVSPLRLFVSFPDDTTLYFELNLPQTVGKGFGR